MTPDQLSQIEARAKTPDCGDNGCRYAKTPRTGMRTNGGCRCVESWRDQIPELVARLRELEAIKGEGGLTEYGKELLTRADKAEARVKELEEANMYLKGFLTKADARVAVLRDALTEIRRCYPEFLAGQLAAKALATLDPTATALTERLKAAEARVRDMETALTKRAIMLPRCPDCGAYVGPQPP